MPRELTTNLTIVALAMILAVASYLLGRLHARNFGRRKLRVETARKVRAAAWSAQQARQAASDRELAAGWNGSEFRAYVMGIKEAAKEVLA